MLIGLYFLYGLWLLLDNVQGVVALRVHVTCIQKYVHIFLET